MKLERINPDGTVTLTMSTEECAMIGAVAGDGSDPDNPERWSAVVLFVAGLTALGVLGELNAREARQ